jgi:GDP-L-fucose synthase
MEKNAKIYIAGHTGLVGSALLRCLQAKGYANIVVRTHAELDLCNQSLVADFFAEERPEYVFLAAAKVGGIMANKTYRADFIFENLQIQNIVIHQSYLARVKKLLFLGSSCIYPKECPQPMKEEYLLHSPLEYTNEPYAIAKIAGMKMCESYNLQYDTNFLTVMPTNTFGPKDSYDLENCHVLPALIRKFHLAKLASQSDWIEIREDEKRHGHIPEDIKTDLGFNVPPSSIKDPLSSNEPVVRLWGSGAPRREFIYSEDLADACVYIMENIDFKDLTKDRIDIRNTHINIGTGKDISIKGLAQMIKSVIGFKGNIIFDTNKPDGTMRKLLDVGKLSTLGWKAKVTLKDGIQKTYENYQ